MQSFLDSNKSTIPEWQDDIRCRGLFASLPASQEVNPSVWNDKVTFWKRVLLDVARQGLLQRSFDQNNGYFTLLFSSENGSSSSVGSSGSASTSCQNVSQRFMRKGLTPKCLGRIWDLMIEEGDLQVASSFTTSSESNNYGLISSAINVVSWTVRRLSRTISGRDSFYASEPASSSDYLNSEKYVYMPLVREMCQKFCDDLESKKKVYYTDYLFTLGEFQQSFRNLLGIENSALFTKSDAEIAARHLETRGVASVIYDEKSREIVVKLKPPNSKTKPSISAADLGVLTIRRTMIKIEDQMQNLNNRIDECTNKAKEYVKRNQSAIAKRYLKSRKLLSNVLQQRSDSLFQLETVMLKLEHVETESEILAAYDVGANSLSAFMKTHGLSVEKIDSTIDTLQEVLADNEEINMAMRQAQDEISSASGVDDTDLEKELDALLQASELRNTSALSNLPSVPTHLPQSHEVPQQNIRKEKTLQPAV